jgi:hypothetical protein|tara:strand:- start:8610 stop:9053 length:444 start_codon:yes stop_codon:yes gene_type:complete
MAIRLSMTEVLSELPKKKTKADKVAWLRQNDNVPFRNVLRLIYDETIEFLLPDSPPPWKPNEFEDEAKTMLYRETRRLKIFFKGGGYDDMKAVKREELFISLLEAIDNEDAELLANNMLSHTKVKGLTKATLEEAFPDLFTSPMDMR